jgi:hypothetical protein
VRSVIEITRGPYGGYWLGFGARLPPVVFTESEALGLVMAVLDGQPTAADVDDPVGSALGKVIRALPPWRAGQEMLGYIRGASDGYGGSSLANAPERANTISTLAKSLRPARPACSRMGLRPAISHRIEVPSLPDR